MRIQVNIKVLQETSWADIISNALGFYNLYRNEFSSSKQKTNTKRSSWTEWWILTFLSCRRTWHNTLYLNMLCINQLLFKFFNQQKADCIHWARSCSLKSWNIVCGIPSGYPSNLADHNPGNNVQRTFASAMSSGCQISTNAYFTLSKTQENMTSLHFC